LERLRFSCSVTSLAFTAASTIGGVEDEAPKVDPADNDLRGAQASIATVAERCVDVDERESCGVPHMGTITSKSVEIVSGRDA
jgi:hypothetical protein